MQRRNFLGLSLTLVGSTVFVTPLSKFNFNRYADTVKNEISENIESIFLVLNKTTNIIHLEKLENLQEIPSTRIIKRAKKISVKDWDKSIEKIASTNDVKLRFNKQKSGIIFETLAIQELSNGLTIHTLKKAAEILSNAFSDDYIEYNKTNWRLYDFMHKIIALNDDISNKWGMFKIKINNADFSKINIPQRNSWIVREWEYLEKTNNILKNKFRHSEKIKKQMIIA